MKLEDRNTLWAAYSFKRAKPLRKRATRMRRRMILSFRNVGRSGSGLVPSRQTCSILRSKIPTLDTRRVPPRLVWMPRAVSSATMVRRVQWLACANIGENRRKFAGEGVANSCNGCA